MFYTFVKLNRNRKRENAEIGVEFYNNTAAAYFEAETSDGYKIHNELTTQQQAALICLLYSSLYPNSKIEELRDLINTCRGENSEEKLDSMLGEADSILSEIVDCASS